MPRSEPDEDRDWQAHYHAFQNALDEQDERENRIELTFQLERFGLPLWLPPLNTLPCVFIWGLVLLDILIYYGIILPMALIQLVLCWLLEILVCLQREMLTDLYLLVNHNRTRAAPRTLAAQFLLLLLLLFWFLSTARADRILVRRGPPIVIDLATIDRPSLGQVLRIDSRWSYTLIYHHDLPSPDLLLPINPYTSYYWDCYKPIQQKRPALNSVTSPQGAHFKFQCPPRRVNITRPQRTITLRSQAAVVPYYLDYYVVHLGRHPWRILSRYCLDLTTSSDQQKAPFLLFDGSDRVSYYDLTLGCRVGTRSITPALVLYFFLHDPPVRLDFTTTTHHVSAGTCVTSAPSTPPRTFACHPPAITHLDIKPTADSVSASLIDDLVAAIAEIVDKIWDEIFSIASTIATTLSDLIHEVTNCSTFTDAIYNITAIIIDSIDNALYALTDNIIDVLENLYNSQTLQNLYWDAYADFAKFATTFSDKFVTFCVAVYDSAFVTTLIRDLQNFSASLPTKITLVLRDPGFLTVLQTVIRDSIAFLVWEIKLIMTLLYDLVIDIVPPLIDSIESTLQQLSMYVIQLLQSAQMYVETGQFETFISNFLEPLARILDLLLRTTYLALTSTFMAFLHTINRHPAVLFLVPHLFMVALWFWYIRDFRLAVLSHLVLLLAVSMVCTNTIPPQNTSSASDGSKNGSSDSGESQVSRYSGDRRSVTTQSHRSSTHTGTDKSKASKTSTRRTGTQNSKATSKTGHTVDSKAAHHHFDGPLL